MVDDSNSFFFFELILGFDERLPDGSTGGDGGAYALCVGKSGERLSDAREEGQVDVAKSNFARGSGGGRGWGGGGGACVMGRERRVGG